MNEYTKLKQKFGFGFKYKFIKWLKSNSWAEVCTVEVTFWLTTHGESLWKTDSNDDLVDMSNHSSNDNHGGNSTVWKVSKYGVFSGPYFPTCGKIRTRKYSVFGHISHNVSDSYIVDILQCFRFSFKGIWDEIMG